MRPITGFVEQSGQHRAFATLVDEHYRSIYRYAFYSVRDHGLAENLCQDVFLKAWRHRSRLRDPGRFQGWLYSIARRTVLDAVRKRGRLKLVAVNDLETHGRETATDRGTDCSQGSERVHAALAKLPEETRAVIVLRVMDGMKNAKIAELLGISQPTASRRLYEGLCALRLLVGREA
jgi:RNA polymerase sigma-70 factor (ECF subfamily)